MPLRRRTILASTLGLAALARPRRAAAATAKNLLLILARGAWDPTYCLDPKRAPECDVPSGQVRRYGPGLRILTSPERPSIDRFFADWGARCAVVNGIWIGSVAHLPSQVRILTGTRSERSPDVAAIFAADAASRRPELALPYVDLGGGAYAGPLAATMGRMGRAGQLITLLGRKRAFPSAPTGETRARIELSQAERAAVAGFARRRAGVLAADLAADDPRLAGFMASLDRAEALRRDPDLRALKTGRATSLADQGELAVAMLAGGVSCAAFLDSGLEWDTHDAIADQGSSHEALFDQLGAIARGLEGAGLLAHTTVAVLSEMGRTPRLNGQAEPGKDHWPTTSALFFGGGIRPGTFGATDPSLGALRVRLDDGAAAESGALLGFDSLAAGLLEHLGISSRPWITTAEPLHGPFAG